MLAFPFLFLAWSSHIGVIWDFLENTKKKKYYCPGPTFSPVFPFCFNCSEEDPGTGGFKTNYSEWFSPRAENIYSRPVLLNLHCLLESSRGLSRILTPSLHPGPLKRECLGQSFLGLFGLLWWLRIGEAVFFWASSSHISMCIQLPMDFVKI